ncbi:MAG: hypothetical protein ACRDRI_22505 [Pseudonocardiaceae bacterium]
MTFVVFIPISLRLTGRPSRSASTWVMSGRIGSAGMVPRRVQFAQLVWV